MTPSLSDDLLAFPDRRVRIRAKLEELVAATRADAGFLVDESGSPFGAVGHVEFPMPHPVGSVPGGEALLSALVGESSDPTSSGFVVERVTDRALLVVVVGADASDRAVRSARREVARAAAPLRRLLLL